MGWFTARPAGPPPLRPGAHRWAVVDVETSGLSARGDRVLSIAALALDEHGRPEAEFSTLLDPGCDPGPVEIHGLTRERLAGSPQFGDVAPQLWELLDGRVLVAHNAAFDHGFLQAEASRARRTLPTRERLCTVALSRRLGLEVPNFKLDTLAGYWQVRRGTAHDAYDDARALVDVFAYSADLAWRLGLPLPLVPSTAAPEVRPFPTAWVKTPSPWHNPGPLVRGKPLVQGMKVVVTGETTTPREELYAALEAAGLEVMSSVSRLTSVVICNDVTSSSGKLARARSEGTVVVGEPTFDVLLRDVRAGVPKQQRGSQAPAGVVPAPSAAPEAGAPVPSTRSAKHPPVDRPRVAPGPYARRRVLVVGGTHDEAATIREAVVARGGSAAVVLSANVTDIVVLAGGEGDRRLERARAAGVAVHRSLDEALVIDADGPPSPPDTLVLPRGGVVDLRDENVWTVSASWAAGPVGEVDVVALILDESGLVATDEDLVFYNAPASDGDAVVLSVDGACEQSVRVDLGRLPEHAQRVLVAAALEGDATFGDLGAVELSVDGEASPLLGSTLDAGTSERTMLLAELYLRADRWRVRVLGQGHDHGLAELLTSHGVDVA